MVGNRALAETVTRRKSSDDHGRHRRNRFGVERYR